MMELQMKSKRCFVLLFSLNFLQYAFSVDWHTVSACYGITHENFMTLECEADTVIALKDVRAMAKLSSTNCPQEETAIAPADEHCCRREADDCGATYTGVVASQYYTLCHGRTSCRMLQPTWVDTDIDTDCDISKYLLRTNYMEMEYQCLSAKSGASPCASVSVTDTSVILWNDGYPNRMQPEQDGCTCSIETSCDTPIQITALDVRFKGDDDCKQGITITESGQTVQIGCESNNNFLNTIIYTSSTGFLLTELRNEFPTYGGQFWFEIKATIENTSITLSCGQLTKSERSPESQDCTTTSTTTTTTSTTLAVTTTTSTTLAITSPFTTTIDTINTTDTTNGSSTAQSPAPNTTDATDTTLNVTTTRTNGLNDTLNGDNLNGTRPTNDSSIDDDTDNYGNNTTNDDGIAGNTTMSNNDTQHTNESIITASSYLTTVDPNLDHNTSSSLTYSNDTSLTTEDYNDNRTSNGSNIPTTQVTTTGDNQTNANNSGDGSNGSTSRTTDVTTSLEVNGSMSSTESGESGETDKEPNGGASKEREGSDEGTNTTESGDGMMKIIIIAVIAALLVTLFIIMCLCRKKIKELLCGEQAKSQVEVEEYRSESPPKYDTMPDYLFPTSDSPVISSAPAGSTQLLFRKHLEKDIFESGFAGRKQQLQPILSKVPTERRLPPVDTSFQSKSKKATPKPQKLGFLNMIMVENQKNPLPFYPDHEGAIRESYGASNHATTDKEVIEKGKENMKRKTKGKRKKKRLMERIHVHSTATHLNPY